MSEPNADKDRTADAKPGTDRGQEVSAPRIEKLFKIMVRQQASDLHLKIGQPPVLRIKGVLQALKSDPLTDRQIQKLVYELLQPQQIELFEEVGSFDFAHEFEGGWRVRVNVYRQRGHISVSCRLVQRNIPSYEELNLPPIISEIAESERGLVLVVGATGTGKSTTLAAMVQQINMARRCHILTIEDPIEFSYRDGKSFVDQREIGLDVTDWPTALKFAMRQDPNVILIGEMRDAETFQAGITASETGHLVLGSMHASNCSHVFPRILEMFPPEKHEMIRQGLAANLRAVIAQTLVASCKEGVTMVPAVEVLLCNPVVRSLIVRNELAKISDVVRAGSAEGMQSMTRAMADLVKNNLVLRKVALAAAPNRDRLDMALRGISVDHGNILG